MLYAPEKFDKFTERIYASLLPFRSFHVVPDSESVEFVLTVSDAGFRVTGQPVNVQLCFQHNDCEVRHVQN